MTREDVPQAQCSIRGEFAAVLVRRAVDRGSGQEAWLLGPGEKLITGLLSREDR
jgi:hypothetical protein